MQELEHISRQLRRRGTTGYTNLDTQLWKRVQNGGNVSVKGKGFARAVGARCVVAAWHGLEGGAAYVRVDPKGPESVIEVKDEELGQRAAIC